MKLPIYQKVIVVVFLFELALALFEAHGAYQCRNHSECWPWFFILALNMPASVLVYQIPFSSIGDTSTNAGILLTSVAFVAVGTLWWSFLLHMAIYIGVGIRRWFNCSEA